MSRTLSARERKIYEEELKTHNKNLERTIQLRTKELEKAKDKAEKANQSKSVFLANMSHDIRTPMNAILGFTDLIHKKTEDEKTRNWLKIIQQSGKNLLYLIDDILDLSKIEAGKLKIKPIYVPLAKVIHEIEIFLSHSAASKNIKLNSDTKLIKNLDFFLDESRIRQILINLIGNAIKFTSEGAVTITTDFDFQKKDLTISIKDSGIGIETKQLKNIFSDYAQADHSGDSNHEGTGLGLAISQKLAVMMGGCISVKSELGTGSTFTITFPCIKLKESKQNLNIKKEKEFIFEPARILIVDDNRSSLEVLKALLEELNLEVFPFSESIEALEAAKKKKI